MWRSSFRECFCEYFQCRPEAFERMVFVRSLVWYARPLAGWLLARHTGVFREDLEFIHEIGGVKQAGIFKTEINRFHGRNVREKGWIRGTFGIRVSAKRLIRLKNRVVFRDSLPESSSEIPEG